MHNSLWNRALILSLLLLGGCSGCEPRHGWQIDASAPTCAPGTQVCEGTSRKTCQADGLAWQIDDCPCGCSATTEGARCNAMVCSPGDNRCDSAKSRMARCTPEGCGWTATDTCEFGCTDALASCNTCQPGARRCMETSVMVCTPSGQWTPGESCADRCDAANAACVTCKTGELRCDPSAKRVERCAGDGKWTTEANCTEGCNPLTRRCNACIPGVRECRFGNLVRCIESGDLWALQESCPLGCDPERTQCHSCKPGAKRCVGGTIVETCPGSGWEPETVCELGCNDDGRCRVCEPGTTRCTAKRLHVCSNDGLKWTLKEACPLGCVDGQIACNVCQPGTRGCATSTTRQICRSDGQGWTMEPCAEVCDSGQCKLCQPQTRRCDDGLLQQCDGSGSQWTLVATCADGCSDEKKTCLTCTPGEKRCQNGELLLTCRDDGNGWLESSCKDGCNVARQQCNSCRPFAARCDAPTGKSTCLGDGSGWLSAPTGCPFGCTDDGRCRVCSAGELSCHPSDHVLQCADDGTSQSRVEGCHQRCTFADGESPTCTDRRYLSVSLGSQFLPYEHKCAIDYAHHLWCWGWKWEPPLRRTAKPQPMLAEKTWKTVADGTHHKCGVTLAGEIWCWGFQSSGELGNGTFLDSLSTPTRVLGSHDWAQVALGTMHTCGITTSGQLHCWGRNLEGELGVLPQNISVPTPQWVNNGQSGAWLRVSATLQTCAIQQVDDDTSRGRLYCWGMNEYGEVGVDPTLSQALFEPVEVMPGTLWRDVETGIESLTCAVRDDGSLWCWGKNRRQLLGADVVSRHTPYKIDGGDWWRVSVGYAPCALSVGATSDAGGEITCWKYYSETTERVFDVISLQQTGWRALARGSLASCAIDTSDRLYCWYDVASFLYADATPVLGGHSWQSIAHGLEISCGLTTTGQLYCWGQGLSWTPTPVPGGPWRALSLFYSKGCAVHAADGKLYCWATYGNAPQPKAIDDAVGTPWTLVALGESATCGIRSDDSLWCWGSNTNGQMGDGTTTSSTTPKAILPGTSWRSVSLGYYQSCGIQGDGSLWCWGKGTAGGLGLGTLDDHPQPARVGAAKWKQVSATTNSTCAIREDDTLWCWGRWVAKSLGPTPLVPQQMGSDRWLMVGGDTAVRSDGTLWDLNWSGAAPLLRRDLPANTSWSSASSICGITTAGALYCWGNNGAGMLGVGLPTAITNLHLESD